MKKTMRNFFAFGFGILVLVTGASASQGTSSSGGTLSPMGESAVEIQALMGSKFVQMDQYRVIRTISRLKRGHYVIETSEADGSRCLAESFKLTETPGSGYEVAPTGEALMCGR